MKYAAAYKTLLSTESYPTLSIGRTSTTWLLALTLVALNMMCMTIRRTRRHASQGSRLAARQHDCWDKAGRSFMIGQIKASVQLLDIISWRIGCHMQESGKILPTCRIDARVTEVGAWFRSFGSRRLKAWRPFSPLAAPRPKTGQLIKMTLSTATSSRKKENFVLNINRFIHVELAYRFQLDIQSNCQRNLQLNQ